MQLMNPFNPLDHDPSQGSPSWPIGRHPVVITAAEVKATNDNNSGKLVFKCRIVDGPNAGFEGDYNLNLYNQSAKAAEIAHRQLSAICHVTQTFQLGQDGTQLSVLFNKAFVVEVDYQKGHEPGVEGSKGYTEIKLVFDMSGNEPGKKGQPQQQAAPQGFGGQQQGYSQPNPQPQPQQQNGAQGGAQAWGGQNNAQPEQPPQGGNGASWGGNGGGQQNPNTNPAPNTGGGWQQNQGGNAQPAGGAWGAR